MKHSPHLDCAVVLLGHGSTKNADSGQAVASLASSLRQDSLFAEVREAFWKQEPHIKGVLGSLRSARVIIIPIFVSDGFFCENIIPAELGFTRDSQGNLVRDLLESGRKLSYARAVGSHEAMTGVLLARASEVVAAHPFPVLPRPEEVTLFIAGHGTEQDTNSRKSVDRHAEIIRAKGIYDDVHTVFMDESPRITEVFNLARTRCVVVVPFFMSDGLHVMEDIPGMLGEPEHIVRQRLAKGQPTWRNPTEKRQKLVWYSRSVGSDPRLKDVILERVEETLAR